MPKAFSLGGQFGRVVPIVGIATTLWDYSYTFAPWVSDQIIETLPYSEESKKDTGQWMVEGGVCFKAGTLVLGNNGFYKVEDIKENDYVLSFNEKLKKTEISTVIKVSKRFTDEILEIAIGNEMIFVTKEHPFYIENRGWIIAGDLKINDNIKTKDGFEKVKSNNVLLEKTIVYNIEVSGNHNYYITNSQMLVHNKKIKSKKRHGKK